MKIFIFIIMIIFTILISMCSSNQTNNNQLQSDEKLETIEEKGIIIKDGKMIDKKFEHLYDKYKLIVYNIDSFKEITIDKPTIILIDMIDYRNSIIGRAYDINGDNIADTTHGMETMNVINNELNLIGLNYTFSNNMFLKDIKLYYEIIKKKILSGDKIVGVGLAFGIFSEYERSSERYNIDLNPENIGNQEIKNQLFATMKGFDFEMIETIDNLAQLTRVYLGSGNDPTNKMFSIFSLSNYSIDVGGANRNWEYPTTLFTDNSEVDRYDRAVSIMFWTENGYDTDEDGLTDFKFDEISQTPLKEYPDDIVWNKNLFGEAVENYIIDIEIINEKLIINNKEYEILELINNWDSFIKKHNNNLFNITQLFAMYNEISHIAEQKGYELNDSIRAILESKQEFEINIGTKTADEGRLFTSLNDFDVFYTKNYENLIVPTKILSGTSYAIEFAINKDYEEGILIPDGY